MTNKTQNRMEIVNAIKLECEGLLLAISLYEQGVISYEEILRRFSIIQELKEELK